MTSARELESVADMSVPPAFDEEHVDAWCEWVLHNGLPGSPRSLALGEAVPIARYVGEFAAGVLVFSRSLVDYLGPEDEQASGVEEQFLLQVELFHRDGHRSDWESSIHSFALEWPDDVLSAVGNSDTVSDVSLLATFHAGGMNNAWSCSGYLLRAPADALASKVDYGAGHTEVRPLDKSFDLALVCADTRAPVDLNILSGGRTVAELHVE